MNIKITATIEDQFDKEHPDHSLLADIQNVLGIVENNLHTPEKGSTSVLFQNGLLHQLIHTQQMQDNDQIRVRIPCCGKWVILCIEQTKQAQSSDKVLTDRF